MTRTGTLPKKEREGGTSRKPEVVRCAWPRPSCSPRLALGATIFSPWTFLVLVMAGGVIVAWEWGRLTRGNGFDGTALIAAVSVAAIAVLVSVGRPDLALFVLAAAAVAIGFTAFPSGGTGRSRAWLTPRFRPPLWCGSAAIRLLGAIAVLYLFAVAWTTDTASYAAGRLIGGPKLAPRISPKKTWSGFIVGALAPALVGYAFAVGP